MLTITTVTYTLRCGVGNLCDQIEEGQRINPSSDLHLITECMSGCPDSSSVTYTWSIFYMGFSKDHWIPVRNFIDYVTGKSI